MTQNTHDFDLSAYDFDLPSDQIADRPVSCRHDSKLLVYDARLDKVIHSKFLNIADYLPSDSLLVLNRSKVFPGRLLGKKTTGGLAELLLLSPKPLKTTQVPLYSVMIKTTGRKKVGDRFSFENNLTAEIQAIHEDGTFSVRFNIDEISSLLEKIGHTPIPPYIRNGIDDERDKTDYQTVYASEPGSIACPTAGLHFTAQVFSRLKEKKIDTATVSLHVGPGTFAPVKCENIMEHKMHKESFIVDNENAVKILSNPKRIAVGTTTLRTLESCVTAAGKLEFTPDEWRSTDIFLHPGKKVHSVSGLVTNFHLPRSTLLMLVGSLIGREKTLELYALAVREKYRFFSYGDAMLILR